MDGNQWELTDIDSVWKDTRRKNRFLLFNKMDGKFYIIPKNRIDARPIFLPPKIDTGDYYYMQIIVPVTGSLVDIDYFERYLKDEDGANRIKIEVHRDISNWNI